MKQRKMKQKKREDKHKKMSYKVKGHICVEKRQGKE